MKRSQRRARSLVIRRRLLLAGWLLGAGAILLRAGQLQLVEGEAWSEIALQQHRTTSDVVAARGTILDRNGVPLALTRERVRVSVAPRELTDRDEAVRLIQETLELPAREARRLTDPARRWTVVPGRYTPAVREALSGVRGLYLEREMERFYPHGDIAGGVLGTVLEGVGQGGIEQRYEDVLRGTPGREVAARDNVGREIPGESVRLEEPTPGGEVRLTLDLDLQEIAHEALTDALERTGARGGDLLVTDPSTGEVLALVSIKDGHTDALSAINAPYEPGSTLKPFTVAGLMARGLASLDDSLETAGGRWTVGGRTLTDVSDHGDLTLREALRVSSNVGIAQAAQAYSPGEQYETLRDFGFGVATGIELPGEVAGTLRRPDRWSRQSSASLAIGYEIGVTPLQMALAYGALANGGVLMEPRLIAEVHEPDGAVLDLSAPRKVRRVLPTQVTRALSEVLEDVVEGGTATAARFETFRVAGKTGTSRAYGDGGYLAGRYFASFAGFFPADDPQLVMFVKLDSPRGSYYGGSTAAPVTRAMMEGALAARQTPLDRAALVRSIQRVPKEARPARGAQSPVRFANLARETGVVNEREANPAPLREGAVTMPDVTGLNARTAVRRLHALGLRVRWGVNGAGTGAVKGTTPSPGALLEPGDTVSVRAGTLLR